MATVTEQVVLEATEAVDLPVGSFEGPTEVAAYDLFARVRKFFWLSSGLFSAASFAIPFVGFVVYGTSQGASTNFLAAIVSASLFGIASLLHFGPETV